MKAVEQPILPVRAAQQAARLSDKYNSKLSLFRTYSAIYLNVVVVQEKKNLDV